jgi:hypothetical protein
MKPNPDKVYGPPLAALFQKFCEMINKESGATGIRVEAQFIFKNGKGDLKMQTFVTPDSKVERLVDSEVPMPRGTKLAHDAAKKLRGNMAKLTKGEK